MSVHSVEGEARNPMTEEEMRPFMPTEAVRLLGAAVALCEETGIALRRFEQAVHDRTVSAMHASLGEESYSTEFELGRAMGLDDAVRYAPSLG